MAHDPSRADGVPFADQILEVENVRAKKKSKASTTLEAPTYHANDRFRGSNWIADHGVFRNGVLYQAPTHVTDDPNYQPRQHIGRDEFGGSSGTGGLASGLVRSQSGVERPMSGRDMAGSARNTRKFGDAGVSYSGHGRGLSGQTLTGHSQHSDQADNTQSNRPGSVDSAFVRHYFGIDKSQRHQ